MRTGDQIAELVKNLLTQGMTTATFTEAITTFHKATYKEGYEDGRAFERENCDEGLFE